MMTEKRAKLLHSRAKDRLRGRCGSRIRSGEQTHRSLISRIDHAVWQVGDLEHCTEVLVQRLGFPLLRSRTEAADLRFVEVDFGGLAVRLVESGLGKDSSAAANLMVVAFESTVPLPEATSVLRQRGFSTSQIHTTIPTELDRACRDFRFSMIRGVAQPDQASLTAAVVLVEPLRRSRLQLNRTRFAASTIHHAGISGVDSITAEVEDEVGLTRWQMFLTEDEVTLSEASTFLANPSLRVVAGSRDGFSSMTIGCHDLLLSARNFESCGVAGYCCRGEILLDPADTGGIALRLTDRG